MSQPQQLEQRVLVVDDDPGMRHLIWTVLRREGLSVATAANTDEAEARLRAERFLLLITDHDMPRESGIDFVHRMRASQCPELAQNRDIPIVMISGRDEPGHIQIVSGAGIRAFLQKPFRASSLTRVVRSLVDGCDEFIHIPCLA